MVYYQHCQSDMCPPPKFYGRHTVACGCGCAKCSAVDPMEACAAAEARAEKAEAEVRYLRARMAWMAARADLGNRTGGHGLRDYIDWLDANPEPQPPPGVEP